MQTVCKAIAELIRQSGKPIHVIADESGVAEATVRNIAHGRSEDPRLSTISAICKACGTKTEHLMRSLDDSQDPEDDVAAAYEHLRRALAAREREK